MSNTFDAHHINEMVDYHLKLLIQQETSVLKNLVSWTDFGKGVAHAVDSMGAVALNKSSAINTPIAMQSIDRFRRWWTTESFEGGHVYDNLQRLRDAHDYQNVMIKAYGYAAARKLDEVLIHALEAPVKSGSSQISSTSIPLPQSQIIAHGGTGLTRAKWELAVRKLRRASHNRQGQICAIMTGYQEDDMLAELEVTSGDFNSMQKLPLTDAQLPYWGGAYRYLIEDMGVATANDKGVLTEGQGIYDPLLPIFDDNGQKVRSIYFFTQDAIAAGYQEEFKTQIKESEAPYRQGGWWFTCQMTVGAIRLDERCVVRVDCVDNSEMAWG